MALDAKHPQYVNQMPDWIVTSDVYAGERIIKEKGIEYLPPTDGMLLDGMNSALALGSKKYAGYLKRAVFPSYYVDAIVTAVGLMHRKPADIKLPAALEGMRDNATTEGESLDMLLRKINEAQLKDGRVGVLLDVPTGLGPEALPFIALYSASRIINWDVGRREQGRLKLEFVVLDESEEVRGTDFTWKTAKKYRPLMLSSELVNVSAENQQPVATGTYITGVTPDDSVELATVPFIAPSIAGNVLTEIPFMFINTNDHAAEVAPPPLMGLANLSLAIYRGEADYRQTLFAQAQETLVIIGGTEENESADGGDLVRAGAGAKIEVPIGGDAKYIGISASGLAEMRQSLENDRDLAQQQGSKMLSTKGGDQQSGDALRTRVAAQTASLPNIAKTSAEALERILKFAAILKGANPEEVEVKPNLDFTADIMSGQNLLQLMQAKAMGAPLSLESIHNLLREQGMTDKTYEEEQSDVDDEKPLTPPASVRGVNSDPNAKPADRTKGA